MCLGCFGYWRWVEVSILFVLLAFGLAIGAIIALIRLK